MVRAAFDHLGHVLCLLVDGHGPDDAAVGRGGAHLDLDGTRLGDLAVELLQQRRVLRGRNGEHGVRVRQRNALSFTFSISLSVSTEG